MPSLPLMCPLTAMPPEDSPPMMASVENIFAEMCLKPTGTSQHCSPKLSATRSSRWVVQIFLTAGPCQPLYFTR